MNALSRPDTVMVLFGAGFFVANARIAPPAQDDHLKIRRLPSLDNDLNACAVADAAREVERRRAREAGDVERAGVGHE